MVLAFQRLHAKLHLCVNTSSKKTTSIACNSQQLSLTEKSALEADDIICINALRQAISTTLCSSGTTIPMDAASTILPLLNCVLRRKALTVEDGAASSAVDHHLQSHIWENAIDVGIKGCDNSDDDDGDNMIPPATLDSFC